MRYKVVIICLAYNQAAYIRSTLDGFVAQRADFPFCAVVMDDHSSDGTADIVRDYERRHPGLIKGIYLSENYYSQDKDKRPLLRPWHDRCDYIALCEGDDCWTDPLKLQRQVDWLEQHPDYTMCCCDAIVETARGDERWHRYDGDCDIPLADMVLGGGLWVHTPTIVFRRSLYLDFPDFCWRCHVADYPLQIWAALRGRVRYMHLPMARYRYGRPDSWASRRRLWQLVAAYSPRLRDLLIRGWQTEVEMLQGLDRWSEGAHHDLFVRAQQVYVWGNALTYRFCTRGLAEALPEVWARFSPSQRAFLILLRSRVVSFILQSPLVTPLIKLWQLRHALR